VPSYSCPLPLLNVKKVSHRSSFPCIRPPATGQQVSNQRACIWQANEVRGYSGKGCTCIVNGCSGHWQRALTLLQKWQDPQGMMNAATTCEPTGSLPSGKRRKSLGHQP